MPSFADLTLWLLITLVEVLVVYLFMSQGLFRKFPFLGFYFLLSVTVSIGRWYVLYRYDFQSVSYAYFYFLTDALLTVFLFLGISDLSVRLAETKKLRRKVVLWSAGALLVESWFSYLVVSSYSRFTVRFAFELSKNIFFACCLAFVLLWVWRLRNEPEDWIAARFVNVLAVYFALFLLTYGLHQFAQPTPGLNCLDSMTGAWLPVGCGFALVSCQQPGKTKH